MMNKLTVISLVSALSVNSLTYAGSMGGGSDCTIGFISLEGGYATHTIDNYDFTLTGLGVSVTSVKKSQHFAGRLAAGAIGMVDDQWGMTGELGWGYYGRTTLDPSVAFNGQFTMQHTLTGFDALVGVMYMQPNFNLYLKGGAMIQNMTLENRNVLPVLGNPAVFNSNISKTNHTAALPEVKVGAGYSFDSNWSITAAYFVAVGSSPKVNGDVNFITGAVTFNNNTMNPTVQGILLGLQYTV